MIASRRFLFFLLTVGLCTAAFSRATAQDTPLDFVDHVERVGLEVGFSSVWQDGSYIAGCGLFDKGTALNIWIAAAYDREMSDAFRAEGLLGYQGRSVRSRFNSRENIGVSTESGPVNAEVDFENIGTASFSYIFFQPGIKFYPIPSIYVGAGASVNFLLNATTQYQKDILSRTVNLNELGVSEVFYSQEESSDPYSKIFPEVTEDGAAGVTFDGVIIAGAEFSVGKRVNSPIDMNTRRQFALSPRIQYTIPFVAALTQDNNQIKLGGLQILFGLRYEF